MVLGYGTGCVVATPSGGGEAFVPVFPDSVTVTDSVLTLRGTSVEFGDKVILAGNPDMDDNGLDAVTAVVIPTACMGRPLHRVGDVGQDVQPTE